MHLMKDIETNMSVGVYIGFPFKPYQYPNFIGKEKVHLVLVLGSGPSTEPRGTP